MCGGTRAGIGTRESGAERLHVMSVARLRGLIGCASMRTRRPDRSMMPPHSPLARSQESRLALSGSVGAPAGYDAPPAGGQARQEKHRTFFSAHTGLAHVIDCQSAGPTVRAECEIGRKHRPEFQKQISFLLYPGCSYNPLLNPLQLPLVTWGASHRALCICASQCQSTVRVWHADAACAHGRVFWGRVRSSASAFWLENGSKKSRSGPPEGRQGISAGRKGGGATSGEPERTDPRSPIRQGARTQIFIGQEGEGQGRGRERVKCPGRRDGWAARCGRPPLVLRPVSRSWTAPTPSKQALNYYCNTN